MTQLIAAAGESAQKVGVVLTQARAVERAHAPGTLARAELALEYQGTYPGIREALATVLQRFPEATLLRLQMRRSATGTVQASAYVAVWGRGAAHAQPLPSSGAGS